MRIGIIVAMGKEMNLLEPLIENKRMERVRGNRYIFGKIEGHDVCCCQCGIGKVNSAITTLGLIEEFDPEIVINTGVAGGADRSMHVLDLFVATEVAYHDVWCGPGTEFGAASGYEVMLKTDERIPEICRDAKTGIEVRYGLICSGDKFISEAKEVEEIKRHFPEALAVDMESASIGQVCVMKGVPFNIIRVISDTPGAEENISQYENFWNDAPRETFDSLREILKRL
ncbi:MAG: 5'-methylthioadenosine/adenosylhomocysteine nucleosidase [Bacteroidales bacterium]|nr:5'-methylthioadenosine/adenosylhomocysteine nucleosidase [Bacteroidales bacterium]